MANLDVREEGFPAPSRGTTGLINDVPTEVTRLDFADKILLTISQRGRLSQWVKPLHDIPMSTITHRTAQIQVPLTGSQAGVVEMTLPSATQSLLPSTHLTPKTILGGGGEERETLGQLYAAQIASHMSLRSPDDRRTLVLGLGLEKSNTEREAFYDLLELVQKVL